MMEEVESNFDVLVRQYPSGMRVNGLLAAKVFHVRQEHIVIGNGAAELIKALLEELDGKIGIIKPTFEEYPNRKPADCVIYDCKKDDFTYDAGKLIRFFTDNPVKTLVLINPDNPSGHWLDETEIRKLVTWCAENGINIVLDESFLDFADEPVTMIQESELCVNPNLYVVKSISKSYGIPGLRLGILASGNAHMVDCLKKKVSIWNINSVAEFCMQILDKYKSDYELSLERMRMERKRFFMELGRIGALKVYPSQANYFMCEIKNGKQSEILAGELLEQGILIKNLTNKIGNGKQYIRIAVRNETDNDMLVKVLKETI
jgi:histidinol-phosphate/aromatic aminotransferase/cobyric acid decarboxylase-like protein